MNTNIRVREEGTGLSSQSWEYSGLLHGLSNEQKEELVSLFNEGIEIMIHDPEYDNQSKLTTLFFPLIRRLYMRGVKANIESLFKSLKNFKLRIMNSSNEIIDDFDTLIINEFERYYLEGEFNASIEYKL
ncbi:MAG: hypothetical protein HC836_36115 [Richelia sp. RM2_1_2]|nr:hypothetical protein [Richelia sp. RM2_1_2]